MECTGLDEQEASYEVNCNVSAFVSKEKLNIRFIRSEKLDGITWTSDIKEFFKVTADGGQLDQMIQQIKKTGITSVPLTCGISKHIQLFYHPDYDFQVQLSSGDLRMRVHLHYFRQMLITLRELIDENFHFVLSRCKFVAVEDADLL
jgi:hypothetical protein